MATPESSLPSRSVIPRLATAFVIGVVSLTLEIAYTRIISFKLFYYYTYFVIGLALLGLGAAGAVTSLSSRLRAIDPVRLGDAVRVDDRHWLHTHVFVIDAEHPRWPRTERPTALAA